MVLCVGIYVIGSGPVKGSDMLGDQDAFEFMCGTSSSPQEAWCPESAKASESAVQYCVCFFLEHGTRATRMQPDS